MNERIAMWMLGAVCGRDVEELSEEEMKRCKTLNSELDSLDDYLKANNCNTFIKGDIQ